MVVVLLSTRSLLSARRLRVLVIGRCLEMEQRYLAPRIYGKHKC